MSENSEKVGKWLSVMDWEEHPKNPLRFVCSNCTALITRPVAVCPTCKSNNPKVGSLTDKPGEIQF